MPKQHMKNPNPRSIEPLCGGWSMASDGPMVTTGGRVVEGAQQGPLRSL